MNNEKKSIYWYIILVFLLTYSWEIGVMLWEGTDSLRYHIGMTNVMWIPAVAVLLSKIFCKEKIWLGFRSDILIWQENSRGIRYMLYAIAAPFACTVLGNLIMTVCYFQYYDYADVEWKLTISGILLQIGYGTVYSFVESLWAEIGWRGFLMPRMSRFVSMPVMLLISGGLWGLWQAPLVYTGNPFGLDYPGAPWMGIFFMCVFCIFNGAWLYFLYKKSKSIIFCALSHGLLNSLSGLAYIGMKENAAAGLVGNTGMIFLPYLPMILLGTWAFWKLCKEDRIKKSKAAV